MQKFIVPRKRGRATIDGVHTPIDVVIECNLFVGCWKCDGPDWGSFFSDFSHIYNANGVIKSQSPTYIELCGSNI